mmetsp:Transcript_30419/g.59667  ORF Transcript_30419/g.59667 Transcript_30419/m.59667 type:complete len:458 (+) Transcript_30419:2-1375(+)
MLTHLTTLNSGLRLEANTARQDAAEASKNLAAANLDASKAREQLAEVRTACDAELAKGKRDVDRMESWVEALRSDADSAATRATMALERVSVAEAAASQSREGEIRARADLQVKLESIAGLEGACHALRADLAKVRGALALEAERASGAERMVEQLRIQLQVAADATDLHESEIVRMAGKTKTDAKASKTMLMTVSEQSANKTFEAVEQALGFASSSDVDRAASETLQQECQLPSVTVHHDTFVDTPTVSKESPKLTEQHACPSDVLSGYRRMHTKKAQPARMTSSHHTKGRAKVKAKGKAESKAKGKARGKAKGKASSVLLRKLHIKTVKVAEQKKQSVRRPRSRVDRNAAASAAAAAAAAAMTDVGSYKNHASTADATTPKRGQGKQQAKVTPQASKEPRKLRARSQINKSSKASMAKLRNCNLSSSALTSETSFEHPAEDPETCNVANLAAEMV